MEKTGKFKLLVIFFFFMQLVTVVANAANIKVEALIDRDQLSIGDSLNLVLNVQSDDDLELKEPLFPKVAGIELIDSASGGRQSSTSMTMINGKTQFIQKTVQSYHFVLSPQKEGTFVIPSIDVIVNNQTYKTQPIRIEVQEEFRNGNAKAKGRPKFPPGYGGSNAQEEAAQNPNSFGNATDPEDLFEQLLKQQQKIFGRGAGNANGGGFNQQLPDEIPSKKLNINTNETFFIYLDADKSEVYEGEQITANWYVYTRADLQSLDRVKFPDLKGFWKEIIEEVPSLQFSEELVNGVRYRKALLASHALFPIKAGVAVIDEFKIKAKARSLSQFGWGQAREYTRASRRAEINVLPLPQEGRTQSFSGAVGNYRVSLKSEGNSFPVNQPFSIKIRYEGIGNAKLIDLPTIRWPDGLEVYDTKSDSKFFKEGQSYKEFEVLLISRKVGPVKIPALDLTYFDPEQKKYVSSSTDELDLQITEGNNEVVAQVSSDITINKNTTAEIKPQPILELPIKSMDWAKNKIVGYLLLLVVGLSGIVSYFIWKMKSLTFEPEFYMIVNSKLVSIQKFLAQNEFRKLGSEATNLIYTLVAQLAGQRAADLEIHLLIKEIAIQDQQLYLATITELFDYFQLVGFAPEELMQEALAKKPMQEQVAKLSELSKEIVAKFKKQDKHNG